MKELIYDYLPEEMKESSHLSGMWMNVSKRSIPDQLIDSGFFNRFPYEMSFEASNGFCNELFDKLVFSDTNVNYPLFGVYNETVQFKYKGETHDLKIKLVLICLNGLFEKEYVTVGCCDFETDLLINGDSLTTKVIITTTSDALNPRCKPAYDILASRHANGEEINPAKIFDTLYSAVLTYPRKEYHCNLLPVEVEENKFVIGKQTHVEEVVLDSDDDLPVNIAKLISEGGDLYLTLPMLLLPFLTSDFYKSLERKGVVLEFNSSLKIPHGANVHNVDMRLSMFIIEGQVNEGVVFCKLTLEGLDEIMPNYGRVTHGLLAAPSILEKLITNVDVTNPTNNQYITYNGIIDTLYGDVGATIDNVSVSSTVRS